MESLGSWEDYLVLKGRLEQMRREAVIPMEMQAILEQYKLKESQSRLEREKANV
jgi:hypothetical protein